MTAVHRDDACRVVTVQRSESFRAAIDSAVERHARTRSDPVHLWTTTGPIQWSIMPPATVGRGESFAASLAVDAARIEGRGRACQTSVAPEDGVAGASFVVFDQPNFSGPAGTVDFVGRAILD